ncbi:MAG: ribose 5-phosphate isomerase B [Eubacteriales bacterium]|nr:ribose 5-phosphate isomerase B [Eubacteriales bacterium]
MIGLGSDHGGYDLKMAVIAHLAEQGIAYKDFGTYDKKSCDYPEYGRAVAEAVASGECEKGIVICTTGIGISIVANKVEGIRCALCWDVSGAKLTRLHNDANVLALGGGMIGENVARDIVDTFLQTPFSGEEKHSRRIGKIEKGSC